jgi:hypothetical protein
MNENTLQTVQPRGIEIEIRPSPGPYHATTERMCESIEKRLTLSRWFNQLSPRDQFVLGHRFGLSEDGQELTLLALGEKMGVSEDKAGKIVRHALGSLRKIAAADARRSRYFTDLSQRDAPVSPAALRNMQTANLSPLQHALFRMDAATRRTPRTA